MECPKYPPWISEYTRTHVQEKFLDSPGLQEGYYRAVAALLRQTHHAPIMPGLKRSAPKRPDSGAEKAGSSKKPRQDVARPPAPSTLTAQEVDFPRGGGTNLTPFEHKQVLREVKEEAKHKKSTVIAAHTEDDDLFKDKSKVDRQKVIRDKKNAQKKKREVTSSIKGKQASLGKSHPESSEQKANRIELLNYKRLAVDTRLFCSVLAVHPLAIILSLPNQLLGHVPITNISKELTDRLEKSAEDEEENEDEDEDDDDDESSRTSSKRDKDVPELRDLFQVGQWVCASVVSIHSIETVRNYRGREGGEYEQESRRVELTLDPSIVNEGVEERDVSPGYILPMTVTSKEDHGYLTEIGVADVKGFIPFKEAGSQDLHRGQVVLPAVTSWSPSKRHLTAELQHKSVASASPEIAPSSTALIPGNLIKALVTNESSAGLNVKLFGMFDGTVDALHMDPAASYRIGQRIKVRVLWEKGSEMDSDVNERKFALSASPHVVDMARSGMDLQQQFPIGKIVKATVVSTIEDWGLMTQIRDTHVKGFTHISAVSDDHIASLPASSGPFRVGTVHEARVIGHSSTDDILRLSFEKKVLQRGFIRVSEVIPGEVMKCTIKAIQPQAIVVDLNGSVDGVVFPTHFADVALKKPEKKYKVGQSVTTRVLQVDPDRNRIVLTLKRTLVQSTLAVVGSIQDARVGIVTHGVVGRVLEGNIGPSAILVDLFGHVRAYVPISEVLESSSTSASQGDVIKSSFFVGKCVKVRLTRVDYDSGRITASIRQASDSYLQRLNVDAVHVGETVQGKLAAIHQDVVVLELHPSNVRALLGLSNLARERNTSIEALRDELAEGELITDLKVLDKKADRGIVIVGGASSKAKVRDADLRADSTVQAKVSRKEGNSVTLHVGTMLRCQLHVTDCVDDFEEKNAASILPPEGTETPVYLLNVRGNASNRRAEVSTRPSRLTPSDHPTVRDAEVHKIDDIKVGEVRRGFVRGMAEKNGLFVELGRAITARVKIAELFDTYVKEWTDRFTIGQLVQGTITGIDAGNGKVEMSLRKNIDPKKMQEKIPTDTIQFTDLHEGSKVKGFIKSIAEYGVFVQIQDTNLSGLAHKSQLSDDSNQANALKAFSIGDRVKAYVLKVDKQNRKISFGLKPSLFDEEDFVDSENEEGKEEEHTSDEEEGEENDSDDDAEMDASALLNDDDSDEELLRVVRGSDDEVESTSDEDDSDNDEDGSASDEDDEMMENLHDDESLDVVEDGQDNDRSSQSSDESSNAVTPALALEGGFAWNAHGNRHEGEQSEESDSSDDEEGRKQKKRRGKKALQEDVTADLATKMPETSQDFERMLLGSPNSSYLWIQFVSFHVQLGDIQKARDVAQHALQTIHFREEQEKFNVWIALLNLENTYGSEESLESTFKEACSFNDAKAVHLRLADILEQSGKREAAQEHWKRTCKKFGFSSKVWVGFHRFLLRQTGSRAAEEEARAIVARSMQSLEKRKHIKTIVAFALDEFRMGDAERGRTIFEGLVDSYPKRLDIWWQYIDQETRLQHAAQVRDLYERILSLKQSSKKIKSILKKWLEFEKRHGNEKSQQGVLERARRFVEEREAQQAAQEASEEDGDAEAGEFVQAEEEPTEEGEDDDDEEEIESDSNP